MAERPPFGSRPVGTMISGGGFVHGSRWGRFPGRIVWPVKAWLSNRWHWRDGRRTRDDIARWEAMVVPVESLTVPMSAAVRHAALLFDRLGVSVVLHFGYGMGEAVAMAAAIDPGRVEPLVDAMQAFTDDELLGLPGPDTVRMMMAVSCRNDLMDAVRDVVAAHPKPGAGGD